MTNSKFQILNVVGGSVRKTTHISLLTFAICHLQCHSLFAARIVSLLPSDSEIVEALGDGQEIVGVTSFEKASGKIVIGDFINPSIEQIVALKPDLILAGAWASSRTVPELKRLNIPVIEVRNPRSIDELFGTIRQISKAVGRPADGERVIAELQKRRAALIAGRLQPALKTYIEIDRPQWTVGGNDFLSEGLSDIGAINIFADLKNEAGQVSSEAIVERNPDLIISLADKKEEIARRPGWSRISAVQRGWIIDDVSPDDLTRPSPRFWNGLSQLETKIHAFAAGIPK